MGDAVRQEWRKKKRDRAVALDRAQAIRDDLSKLEAQKVAAAAKAKEERKQIIEAENAAALQAAMRKVLVCGDACGKLDKIFSTVEGQAAKVGAFDLLLVVGSFLPQESNAELEDLGRFLTGEKVPPLPTFFIDAGPTLIHAAPEGKQFSENLRFLGGYGVCNVGGLRTAYLSGRYDPARYDNNDVDFVGGCFTMRAVSQLRGLVLADTRQQGVDILLTCGWPQDLHQKLLDEASLPPELPDGNSWRDACAAPLAELCLAIEPRYHIFASADVFYARPPFQVPKCGHMCRLVGLGRVGSASKQRKWLHALSLGPMALMKREDLKQLPANVTPCPFSSTRKRFIDEGELFAERPAVASSAAGLALGALASGDLSRFLSLLLELDSERLYMQSIVSGKESLAEPAESGLSSATKIGRGLDSPDVASAKRNQRSLEDDASKNSGSTMTSGSCAVGVKSQQKSREAPEEMSEEEGFRHQRAAEFLRRPPEPGSVRYTFSAQGSLGIRLSRDVPPWILEVRDGSLAAKKAPKVPLGGIVLAVNGFELNVNDNAVAIKALSERPVVLDIKWPDDQGKPTVNRA